MSNNSPIEKLPPIKEDLFTYYNISEKYEVTINTINGGLHIPDHKHEENVYNLVLEGEVDVIIDGQITTYQQGNWMFIPANKTHAVNTLKDTQLLELWEK